MPVTYSIDHARRLVTNLATGILSDDDMREAQAKMRGDPEWNACYSQLFDLTAVSDVRISTDYLRAMAANTAFAPGARRALVVNKPVLFGLSRMYQVFLGDAGNDFGVFYNRQEAEDWLEGGGRGAS